MPRLTTVAAPEEVVGADGIAGVQAMAAGARGADSVRPNPWRTPMRVSKNVIFLALAGGTAVCRAVPVEGAADVEKAPDTARSIAVKPESEFTQEQKPGMDGFPLF
jgi:hypothetical protein